MSEPTATSTAQADLLEKQALAFLAQGKFRKARDEAKLLRKLAPARGLPLLIRANVELARDLSAKGQVSEAQQVLAYLATIASPAELEGVKATMAFRSGSLEETAPAALRLLIEARPSMTAAEKYRAADALVLAGKTVKSEAPGAQPFLEDRARILEAFQALANRDWTRAQDALRPLSQRSGFSHWKLFLKGLIAFHTGERARAARCFAELPPETVPAAASEAYRLWLEEKAGRLPAALPSELALEGLGLLAGRRGLGTVLRRAEDLWRHGKAWESYRTVREGLAGFPSEQPDLPGALTDLYFNALHEGSPAIREDLDRHFDLVLAKPTPGPPLERALMYRAMALADGPPDPEALTEDWLGFLTAYEELHGPNPKLASKVYARLGMDLAQARPQFRPFAAFQGDSELLAPDQAVWALERSVGLDPTNLQAALQLCDVYSELRRARDHNRLLDAMVERFPENKSVLLRAAGRCVDRKAFSKALDYLARGRQLDLLDPALIQQTIRALTGQAREYFKKSRPPAARAALDQLLSLAVDQPSNLLCARWCLLARRAAIEESFGAADLASGLLDAARPIAPSPEALLLFAHLAALSARGDRYDRPTRYSGELVNQHLKGASVAGAVTLFRIHRFWTGSEAADCPAWLGRDPLSRYLRAALERPFGTAEARQLLEQSGIDHPAVDVAALARGVLARDPDEPCFRLGMLLQTTFTVAQAALKESELRSIADEARRRGDEQTASQALRILDGCTAPPDAPPLPPFGVDDFDDEDLEMPFGFDADDFQTKDADPFDPRRMTALRAMLEGLSPSALKQLRKALVRDGVPAGLLDLIQAGVFEGKPPPASPPPPPTVPPRPPPKRRPPEPNGPDLQQQQLPF